MWLRIALAITMMFALSGCGGGGGGSELTIAPGSLGLSPGQSITFTVTTPDVGGGSLYWSCDGGTFSDQHGRLVTFTATTAPGVYILTASDGRHSGSIFVMIG